MSRDASQTSTPSSAPLFLEYDWVVVVPAHLRTKASLMQVLADRLGFPKYFGGTWDALSDCLRDLSWLPDGHIQLMHEDLPLAHDLEAAADYVDVLLDVQEDWAREGKTRLTAVFPGKHRDAVRSLERREDA